MPDNLALRARIRGEVIAELQTSLREAGAVTAGSAHLVALTDYEIANLREALVATGYGSVYRSPLGVLNSGDWLGQVVHKLQQLATDHWTCATAEDYAKRARAWNQKEGPTDGR